MFIPKEQITHIIEIGAGYGNLCRLIHNFGYVGKYTIVDFPEMLVLQRDYLTRASVYNDNINFSPLSIEDIIPNTKDVSILIGTFSISEMPLQTRNLLKDYYRNFDYLFIAHNSVMDGIDNFEYFSELGSFLQDDFEFTHVKDKHKLAWFWLGKKKEK